MITNIKTFIAIQKKKKGILKENSIIVFNIHYTAYNISC